MHKLLFIWMRDFNSDIELIANNHKDLEEYLNNNFDLVYLEIKDDQIRLKERTNIEIESCSLTWVKHI